MGRIFHIVCFKFKPGTAADILSTLADEANKLPTRIKDITFSLCFRESFTTDRAKGFSHVLHSTFNSRGDLEVYAKHPFHIEFVQKAKPHLEDVMAVDVEE